MAHGGGLLPAFVARLRELGLDPDAEQLCDALWLAQWTRRPEQDPEPGPGPTTHAPPDRDTGPRPDPLPAATEPQPAGAPASPGPGPTGDDRRITLYPVPPRNGPKAVAGRPGSAALPLGVPAAPSLPAPLELQRALRPLQRYRPAAAPLRRTLDETETAELSARAGGLIIPVFRGVRRADALLQFVMDASSSMRVWNRLFIELQQIFGQLGAFRDVRVRYLHEGPDGLPVVSRSLDPAAAPLHSADRLSDPTGRRVTVLLSDCAGPLWRSGRAHRLLHQLARQAPAAVVQPLPQRMWNRTRLPVTHGVLSRGEGVAGAAVLRVGAEAGGAAPPRKRRGELPIPVLPPVAPALGAWATLLSGTGAGRVSGAVGWVRTDHEALPAPGAGRRLSSLQLVSNFRSAASPAAGQLAVYLAAAPLHLPVMQLVQRTMLPDSGPSELAEVLLSGLLTRAGDGGGRDDGQWYAFVPGVQEALLGPLGRDEALLVLKHCSEYVEQRFGKGGPNFPALALAQLDDGRHRSLYAAGGGAGDDFAYGGEGVNGDNGDNRDNGSNGENGDGAGRRVPHPFAEVAARVLERFLPLPQQFVPHTGTPPGGAAAPGRATGAVLQRARALLRQFESDGMVQYLMDAVQLLRGAVEREQQAGPGPAPELWAEFARCLLRLWDVQGDGGLLREAERAAERASAQPGAVRERAVLANVLHAAADDRRRHGDRRGALELLRRADREYTAACAAPGLDPAEALRLTLERVRALEAQWRLGGDSALLQGAVGMLEAFADSWPDQENRPLSLPLAHGRALLNLSGATTDTEQSRVYAGQAARSLRKAFAPTDGSVRPDATGGQTLGTQLRTLLDLVDALLRSGDGVDEAGTLVEQALETAREPRLRASLETRAGRVGVARYERSGDAAQLERAAEWFGRASRGVPRDSRAHADLLAEWGSALLRRAELPDGRPHTGAAVRVLRDCRTETAAGSAHQADRLLMLGRALMLRHRATDDRVDLREAEHLFGLAAREARDPLTAAGCWLELGKAQLAAYRSLGRPARLDEAAEAFRDAAESAREAEAELENPQQVRQAVELNARANHWRGRTYEDAGRPRAAREAYRAAAQEWRKLPDQGGAEGEATAERLAELGR
ncbi:SAV_2336 N-terminal domain-related protein [Streptomyces sp. NPDC002133]|uniref:SAV_2336 N-terminal domain-related protein n=1 Tax=Streptomyces sp. NPDC002133 TaxID=3154409 RepID=UPI00331E36BA